MHDVVIISIIFEILSDNFTINDYRIWQIVFANKILIVTLQSIHL